MAGDMFFLSFLDMASGVPNSRSIVSVIRTLPSWIRLTSRSSRHTMGADGCITATKMLVSLNSLNHGLAMSNDGKTLYASSMTTVYAWPYTASSTSVGTRTTIITGMYNGGAHTTRVREPSVSFSCYRYNVLIRLGDPLRINC